MRTYYLEPLLRINLEFAYQYLLTIFPTSIEAERAFSAGGIIANKISSRLGDNTLDALIFFT